MRWSALLLAGALAGLAGGCAGGFETLSEPEAVVPGSRTPATRMRFAVRLPTPPYAPRPPAASGQPSNNQAPVSTAPSQAPAGQAPTSQTPPGQAPAGPAPTSQTPPGQPAVPAVILLHGCGGIGASMDIWAERLNGWGYAAIILDSFGPRGVTSVCPPPMQPLVTPRDRAVDVLNMAVILRSIPGIDASRIGVLGLSHGGATAAWVTQRRYEAEYPHLLRAAVDYYGGCRSPDTKGTVPLLVLAGEADDWGHPAQTCQSFGARLKPDQVFELHTYPGVFHGFDRKREGLTIVEGHRLSYDAAAAEDSFQRTHGFLDRYLKDAHD